MRYPIGIQAFRDVREGDYVYVDKTALIYDLVKDGKYYFLSRPRRFGKSLLVSTLEAYFLGKRELFQGLAIDNLEKDWEEYPVLHLDLSNEKYSDKTRLESLLNDEVTKWEKRYGSSPSEETVSRRFGGVIQRAYEQTGHKVVILIDEYDAPLVNLIDKEDLLEDNRETLSAFYKNIKANDGDIQFAFLTGVTKFGQLSVFSALNNLNDISLSKRFQTLCGVTEEELHAYFDESVEEMAEENDISKDACYERLKEMYDGYHFYKNGTGVYNPFSLLNALFSREFGSYWFQSGTPTALIKALKSKNVDITQLPGRSVSPTRLANVNSYQDDLTALLYQSGYLTISGESESGYLTVDFPNQEVRNGFYNQLLPIYTSMSGDDVDCRVDALRLALIHGDVEAFITEMRAVIASLQYQFFKVEEQAFQFIFGITGTLIGGTDLRTDAEKRTNRGRVDMLIETRSYVYIIEFKLDQSPEAALQQIRDKGYAEAWQSDPREKILLGVNFSSVERNIPDGGWKVAKE